MIEQAKLDELTLKHGRIRVVDGDGWCAVLSVPNVAAMKRYKHELHDATMRADAQENLFRKMAVECWTEWDGSCDVAKLLERVPLAPEGCSDSVSALTGLKAQERSKA